jgi:ABC-type polysaccharide/polyol phosphate transport system ATPase subunit
MAHGVVGSAPDDVRSTGSAGPDEARPSNAEEPGEERAVARGASPVIPSEVPALAVRDLGVQYNLRFTKKTTLRASFTNLLNREHGDRRFWALRNATFTVNRGESVGVIGPNGAGKSTLLLVLAGIITPSEGLVEVNGHISTLLSLQAGFDQDLSGLDNIALAGALLGIPHETMVRITPDIVEFADIGAFIDAPLKTYSSGMRARLGFSIATSVDPDILLLDEVLQTGDEVFREKSRQRIISVLTAAKAVVLVTHDMTWVTEFCTRAILIEDGRVTMDGVPEDVVRTHKEHSAARRAARREAIERMRRGEIAIDPQARRLEPPQQKRRQRGSVE